MSFIKSWEFLIACIVGIYYIIYSTRNNGNELSDNIKQGLQFLPTNYINSLQPNREMIAYIQYATNLEYLNIAIMNFITIKTSNTIAKDVVILFNEDLVKSSQFVDLQSLANQHSITMKPIKPITVSNYESDIWKDSFTKFHIFNETSYDRIVYFDADSLLLQGNLDELFNIPDDYDICMPQAYWLSTFVIPSPPPQIEQDKTISPKSLFTDKHKQNARDSFFGSHVIVFKPNTNTFKQLLKYVHNPIWWYITSKKRLSSDYDMEVLNKFVDDCIRKRSMKFGILDHRIYGVLTGEFRQDNHNKFLADPQNLPYFNQDLMWKPEEVILKAKLIHFSDDPIPKPWEPENNQDHYNSYKIYCNKFQENVIEKFPGIKPKLTDDCESVAIWDDLRSRFRDEQRRYWLL